MLTVGQVLKKQRLEKNLSIEQAERATKIRAKFLENLENNDFTKIGSATILKGFIKNYASYLGIETNQIMAFYRRQADEDNQSGFGFRTKHITQSVFKITPRLFTIFSVAILLAGFVGFLVIQFFNFTMAPPLTIETPKDNLVVTVDQIEIKGKTDPEATVFVNDELVRTSDGKFSAEIPLNPGLNVITVKSSNKFQRETIVTRHLRLEK